MCVCVWEGGHTQGFFPRTLLISPFSFPPQLPRETGSSDVYDWETSRFCLPSNLLHLLNHSNTSMFLLLFQLLLYLEADKWHLFVQSVWILVGVYCFWGTGWTSGCTWLSFLVPLSSERPLTRQSMKLEDLVKNRTISSAKGHTHTHTKQVKVPSRHNWAIKADEIQLRGQSDDNSFDTSLNHLNQSTKKPLRLKSCTVWCWWCEMGRQTSTLHLPAFCLTGIGIML